MLERGFFLRSPSFGAHGRDLMRLFASELHSFYLLSNSASYQELHELNLWHLRREFDPSNVAHFLSHTKTALLFIF